MSAAIIKRFIPDEKALETKTKKDLLSYSGSWKEMDAEVFDDYMLDIAKRRRKAFCGRSMKYS